MREKKLNKSFMLYVKGMSISCLVIDFVEQTHYCCCKINMTAALQQLLECLTLRHELSTAQSVGTTAKA